jgi:protein-S-isoprenylcysteine O-methyltransferase Ste14
MIPMTPEISLYDVWLLWAVSWLVASIWASRAQSRLGFGPEAAYRILTITGFVLLFFSGPRLASSPGVHVWRLPLAPTLAGPLWSLPDAAGWAMVGLAVSGVLFAWWARIHLGALWSGSITRKADHRIVDTGPYGIVRHPIYTGLIAAALALAVVKASPVALAGLALMTIGYWLKGKMEENFLRSELGPDDYDAYRKRVPMLIPFFPA